MTWTDRTWGDLIELKYGKGLRDYKTLKEGVPVFGTNGQVGFADIEPLSPIPSIIIGRKGAYREVHFSDKPFYVIDTAYYVVPKESFDIKWAYYSLKSIDINALDSGSAIPSTRREDVYSLSVKVPPPLEQRKIGFLITTIEEKIKINHKLNAILEEISNNIFKSWFVDFDPVLAKKFALEAGLTADQAERTAMAIISGVCSPIDFAENSKEMDDLLSQKLAKMSKDEQDKLRSLATLFPSELEESGLGEIPKGWADSTIGDEFHLTMGQSPKGDTYNNRGEGTVFYQGRTDFGDRFPTPRVYTTDPKRMAMKGDTLISVRAPVGDKNIAKEDCCIGRGLASLRHKSGALSYTYYLVSHIEGQLDNFAGGGTVFSAINKDGLANFKIIKPIKDLVKRFEELIHPLDSMIWNHSDEIITLERIRDTLLPKLLAGEIDLSNIPVEGDELC